MAKCEFGDCENPEARRDITDDYYYFGKNICEECRRWVNADHIKEEKKKKRLAEKEAKKNEEKH